MTQATPDRLTAAEASAQIRAGTLTAEALARACLRSATRTCAPGPLSIRTR